MSIGPRPSTLRDLRSSGWQPRTVKQEIRANFLRALQAGEALFPGIIGYDSTVIPEINLALIAGHDLLFLGEKGQAKSRLMRSLVRFLDPELPYLDLPGCPVHEDPFRPITAAGKRLLDFKKEKGALSGRQVRCRVRITLQDRENKTVERDAVYLIDTIPRIVIVRDSFAS